MFLFFFSFDESSSSGYTRLQDCDFFPWAGASWDNMTLPETLHTSIGPLNITRVWTRIDQPTPIQMLLALWLFGMFTHSIVCMFTFIAGMFTLCCCHILEFIFHILFSFSIAWINFVIRYVYILLRACSHFAANM